MSAHPHPPFQGHSFGPLQIRSPDVVAHNPTRTVASGDAPLSIDEEPPSVEAPSIVPPHAAPATDKLIGITRHRRRAGCVTRRDAHRDPSSLAKATRVLCVGFILNAIERWPSRKFIEGRAIAALPRRAAIVCTNVVALFTPATTDVRMTVRRTSDRAVRVARACSGAVCRLGRQIYPALRASATIRVSSSATER